MGILVSPAYVDEDANGVILTKNIVDKTGPGFYVSIQVGNTPVTNPPPGIRSEEDLVYWDLNNPVKPFMFKQLQKSNLKIGNTPPPAKILTQAYADALGAALAVAHKHFMKLNEEEEHADKFALDLEFRIHRLDGQPPRIFLKQARPYAEPKREE